MQNTFLPAQHLLLSFPIQFMTDSPFIFYGEEARLFKQTLIADLIS